jgi:hypothetical protein
VIYRNWDTIWAGMQAAVAAVWDWIKTYWPLLLGILLGPIGIAVALIYQYWDQIKAGAAAVVAFITSVWDSLVSFFAGIPGRVAGFFTAIWDGIKNGISDAVQWVSDRIGDIVRYFTDLPGKIPNPFDALLAGAKTIFNAIADAWNNTVGKVSFSIPDFVPGLGGKSFGFPTMPHWYASGGIFTAPSIIGVAERGPEAVVPLEQLHAGPAVVVQHAQFSSDIDIDLFMARVAWQMQRQRV